MMNTTDQTTFHPASASALNAAKSSINAVVGYYSVLIQNAPNAEQKRVLREEKRAVLKGTGDNLSLHPALSEAVAQRFQQIYLELEKRHPLPDACS